MTKRKPKREGLRRTPVRGDARFAVTDADEEKKNPALVSGTMDTERPGEQEGARDGRKRPCNETGGHKMPHFPPSHSPWCVLLRCRAASPQKPAFAQPPPLHAELKG